MRNHHKKGFISLPLILLISVTAAFLLLYIFIFQPVKISGQAMNPNYIHGEQYIVNKLTYRFFGFNRGDVVMFEAPETAQCPPGTGCTFISRVIAIPGDKITLKNEQVWLNGQLLEEEYLRTNQTHSGGSLPENEAFQVPSYQFVVLGDNRNHSADSRRFGPVPKENIIGKLSFCYANCN